ncbi:MAG: LuxR C-terminal-related transcriptional regulator [Sterolibacterium sp.]|jgi:DNA-binding NarL/FixJ family response regulator
MDAFVRELSRLYRLATSASVEEFPQRVLAQLRDWIAFDGAVFGFGESGANSLKIGSSAIYNRDPAILHDYQQVSDTDPTTRRFMQTPGMILNVDTQAAYTGREFQPVAKFSSSHDLRHLLLLGEQAGDRSRLRWIVLYRGTRKGFDSHESKRLAAAWDHVLCALELNRSRALDLHALSDERRSLALVNRSGTFEIADPAFLSLLRNAWRDLTPTQLPAAVVLAMQAGKPFVGRELEIMFSRRGDFVLCEAHAKKAGSRLSPRETQVAEYFATGRSYKEIASTLGVSPNTVHAQLARVYQKLGISDKALLSTSLANARHRES